MLALAIGMLLLVIGFSDATGLDVILVTMTMGIVIVNIAPLLSEELFALLKNFSVPIYVMFFVLVGARLSIGNMPVWLWFIVFAYIVGRSLGKMFGAYFGAKLSHADRSVQYYSGLGLFCQGGVAIGLAIMASQHMGNVMINPDLSLGDMVIFGITASTLIVQLIGPSLVKIAISRGHEIGRNVTDEDIIASLKTGDVMVKDYIAIPENLKINSVFTLFSNNRFVAYPLTNENNELRGIITLHNLKDILVDPSCWQWMVAGDASMPVPSKITETTPLKEALDILISSGLESLPVVSEKSQNTLVGMLEKRTTDTLIKQEVIRRQSHVVGV
jgi:CBS domain-containing protein